MGVGTTFLIFLPVAAEELVALGKENKADFPLQAHGIILLVEDEGFETILLREIIRVLAGIG